MIRKDLLDCSTDGAKWADDLQRIKPLSYHLNKGTICLIRKPINTLLDQFSKTVVYLTNCWRYNGFHTINIGSNPTYPHSNC